MTNDEFLTQMTDCARAAGHIWPEYAACEAALESNWGKSQLFKQANNVFGQKQSRVPIYETYLKQTKEYIGGKWITIDAKWVKFPDVSTCFKERMNKLNQLSRYYTEYANALKATTGEEFITQVSARWATDPERGAKVLQIYNKHFGGKK